MQVFRKLRPDQCLATIESAWSIAGPHDTAELAPHLVQVVASTRSGAIRGRALRLIACRWAELPEGLRERFRSLGIETALDAAAAHADARARLSAAALAADVDSDRGLHVLGTLAADRDHRVAESAATQLLALVRGQSADRARLAQMLARAVAGRTRLARPVALASLALMDAPYRATLLGNGGAALASELTDRDRPALRSALRNEPDAQAAACALGWLAHPGVARLAAQRLDAIKSESDWTPVLERWHLLLRPTRAHALHEHVKVIKDPPVSASRGPAPVQIAFVAARQLLPGAARAHDAVLSCPSAVARLRGLRSARGRDLQDFLYDPCAAIAASAASRWSLAGVPWRRTQGRPGEAQGRHASRLTRHAEARVRTIASRERHRFDGDISTPIGRLAWRRALTSDSERRARISTMLGSQDQRARLDAVLLVRALGFGSAFVSELLRVLERAEPGDRAAAASTGALRGVESAADALRDATRHPDPRLAADALAALASIASPSRLELLGPAIDDPRRRMRGNAARAAIAVEPKLAPSALSAVRALLLSEDPDDRSAGLWVVTHAPPPRRDEGWDDIRGLIAALAVDERDPRAQARARHCADRLALRVEATA